MKHIYLPVTARSPLTIRADHAPDGAATTKSIPGATLLGSLAAAHRILRPGNDEEFTTLFLTEQIYIPYLYPATFKITDFDESTAPVMPLPKTAQTCKRFSGFKPLDYEDPDEKRHGIRDSLLDWAVFTLLKDEPDTILTLLTVLDTHKDCNYKEYSNKACKQLMDRATGYYRCDIYEPELRMLAKIDTHLQTRTGINRSWGIVEEGILYNREVFDEGTRFWGEVILPDELSNTFMEFVKEANEEDVIHIGTGRTRGLGRIEIGKLSETQREDFTTFAQRLDEFNEALKKRTEDSDIDVQGLAPFYFAITLYSPTILCDAFLRYRTTLDATTLAYELKLPADTYTFTQIYQATEMQRITGWNELWGTPRPNDYALEMGSTFLFSCDHEPDNELRQALYTLEETGLGRRRAEGFGRIRISDRFHLQGEQA